MGGMQRAQKPVRLTKAVAPERYKIFIHPDTKKSSFEGSETIVLSLKASASCLTLHAKDLIVEDVSVRHAGHTMRAIRTVYDDAREEVVFYFPKKIPKGSAELSLKFRGRLQDTMKGFYKSVYHHKGKERAIATTQFEATDARRAFPCFDEPSQKAIFDITLMVPKGHTAISNTMPKVVREHEGGFRAVTFVPTPKMSTYLVAFIVGEFEYIEAKTKRGVLVRVFVAPGKKVQARFALQCATKILSFYESYFGIRYPLPVLDLIAIPDFAAGAMENWGAVTYRETSLLIDPDNSSLHTKQWVALVIAHELAHQWFGNLVTMEWWTHLWLNEGFASYIEYLAVDHIFPTWNIWRQFMIQDHDEALVLDGLLHTHPVEVAVSHPNEINEIFDAVSYSKGASLIRMLASYVGDEAFRRSLVKYLRTHQYGNATTEDLWKAFEHVSKKPIRKLMRAWTKNPGYPLLKIQRMAGNRLLVEQGRFFSSALSQKKSQDKSLWPIPFLYCVNGMQHATFITKRRTVIDLPSSQMRWVKANDGEYGFYRVDYSDDMSALLAEPIRAKRLSLEDRFGILRDAFAVAEAGTSSVAEALELAESYREEREYSMWLMLAGSLSHTGSLFVSEPWYEEYRAHVRYMFADVVKRVGWQKKRGERHEDTLLRSLVIQHAGMNGDQDIARHACAMLFSSKPIPPEIRSSVYAVAARTGGKRAYDELLRRYHRATFQEERSRILRALALTQGPLLVRRTIQLCFSKHVRAQDIPTGIVTLLQNRYARAQTWAYLKGHWDEVLKLFAGGHLLPRVIDGLTVVADEDMLKDIRSFFSAHKAPGAERTIRQVLESIESNIAWKRRDREAVRAWLQE